MKNKLYQMPLIKGISQSFSRKIIAVTLAGLILGFMISLMTSNSGLNRLKTQSVDQVKETLIYANRSIYINALNSSSKEIVDALTNALTDPNATEDNANDKNTKKLNNPLASKTIYSLQDVDSEFRTAWTAWQEDRFADRSTNNLPLLVSVGDVISNHAYFTVWIPKFEANHLTSAVEKHINMSRLLNQSARLSGESKGIVRFTGFSNGVVFGLSEDNAHDLGLDNAVVDYGNLKGYKVNESTLSAVKSLSLPGKLGIHNETLVLNGSRYWVITKRLTDLNFWNETSGIRSDFLFSGMLIPEPALLPNMDEIESGIANSAKIIILKQSGILMLLFAFIATIIFVIYEQLSFNLNKLMAATEQIKRRNFNIEVELEANDEFNALAQSFNSMTSEIKAVVQQLTAQNELLKAEMDQKIRMDEQISYMKQYDSLTGLPNKQSLYKRIEELIAKSYKENRIGAAVVIGLDQFKKINEVYGIETGDELLKIIAERMRTRLGADVVSRLTGDEFCMVFYGMHALDDVLVKLERLQHLINEQFTVSDHDVYLSASMGIASFPSDARTAQDLVKFATTAMINAKEYNQKDQYRFYDANIEKNLKSKVEIMNSLRQAIDKNELNLVYQPITHSHTGKILGLEALLRWQSPEFGYIPPNIFIPLAEEMRYIGELERWVVQHVIRDLDIIDASNLGHAYLSINVSAVDLDSHAFMEFLSHMISQLGSRASRIQLEITESVLISHYDSVVPKLIELSKLGVRIALDDFGTGYSSLKYIKHLPIHCLKLDRSFVKDYPSFDDGSIAKIVITLAQAFNLNVIAEGVETEKQANFLSEIGCTSHQGFYYYRPMPLGQLIHDTF